MTRNRNLAAALAADQLHLEVAAKYVGEALDAMELLKEQLDAVHAERDALRAVVEAAYAYFECNAEAEGVDYLGLEELALTFYPHGGGLASGERQVPWVCPHDDQPACQTQKACARKTALAKGWVR